MKKTRSKRRLQVYLAVLTFLSLIMLIFIQVSWIMKAASFEEKAFNDKVATSMKCVKKELSKRASDCTTMNDYLTGKTCPSVIRKAKIDEIDSIVQWHLDYNNIVLDYDFSIGDSIVKAEQNKLFRSKCYLESLNGLIEDDGIRICIRFPSRNQFLIAQMKGWFIVSILFILFIATSFFITLRLFIREKALMVRTTDFINNMVHEFQTPLANIKFASNLIRKKNTSHGDDKIEEYAKAIDKESNKLEVSVGQILNLACPARVNGNIDSVNIHEVIHKTIENYQYLISQTGCQINLELNAKNAFMYCDKEQLQLLFSNLIDNALKYSQSNPVVYITTRNEKNNLLLSIRDNGIGIEKKYIANIFDKYYRVSTGDVHEVKGFGLGLTYVKKIVDFYGGSIKVVSEPGVGTEFLIQFNQIHGQTKN